MGLDEAKLIAEAIAGDSTALQRLFYLYHKRLRCYVIKHLPPKVQLQADVQDVVQDVLFEVTRRIKEFKTDEKSSFVRWMMTIARNRIIDLSRRANRRGERLEINGDEDIVRLVEELMVYSRTPSRSAAAHEFMATFETCLSRLSQDHRQAIRLRYIDGLSVDQAADKMRRSKGAFHMLCNRGLKALRSEMQSASRFT